MKYYYLERLNNKLFVAWAVLKKLVFIFLLGKHKVEIMFHSISKKYILYRTNSSKKLFNNHICNSINVFTFDNVTSSNIRWFSYLEAALWIFKNPILFFCLQLFWAYSVPLSTCVYFCLEEAIVLSFDEDFAYLSTRKVIVVSITDIRVMIIKML